MKKEDLFESLTDIDETSVKNARNYSAGKKHVWAKWGSLVACAAALFVVVVGVPLVKDRNQQAGNNSYPVGVMKVMAAYPEPVAAEMSAQEFVEDDAHWNWWDDYREKLSETEALNGQINKYYSSLMEKLLVSKDDNTVCSPLNTYIAFSMLAEVSDGNTRQQILDMLGASDIETLRKNVSKLWEINYVDTPVLKSLLANSLWLDNSVNYNNKTLNRLAEQYYASSFSGVPGSAEMNEALRTWTDSNTGGLLSDYTKDMSISPDTVLEILSTIYYKAMWFDEFRTNNTTQETFHGTKGDTTVDMMHKTDMMGVYRTSTFTALGLGLNDSGSMYFYLPNDGVNVNSLASDPDILKPIQYKGEDENWFSPEVNLSVPKFKVSSKTDLLEIIRELGVTDALDNTLADFTPLTEDRDNLYLSKAEHAAMIEIDEHGVTGAAYTELALAEGAAQPDEKIDFVVDRPFMFIVTGGDGSILFAGIVKNID